MRLRSHSAAWLLYVCLAFLAGTAAQAQHNVADSAGRIVSVPDRIERVFAAGPPASVLIYMLAPETLTGWPRALRPEERDYIAAPYRDLPETGRLTGRGDTANLEVVLKTKPDIILDFGSVRDTYISLADAVQGQTRIPYLLIDGRLDATPAALRLVGDILGRKERGEQLATYVERLFSHLDVLLAETPEGARPRVYLARGPDGLETGLKGSINTEIIERAGGRNVADTGDGRKGLVQSSIEQVIVANPEIIVTWDRNFFAKVFDDPLWQQIDAVKNRHVYLSPTAPFGWIDRPPSVNRIIGLVWMARLLYPHRFTDDFRMLTREFYRLFYSVELDDQTLDRLLQWSQGKAP